MSAGDKLQVYSRRYHNWYVITCPGIDAKVAVVGKTLQATVWRAEQIFDVTIPMLNPEAA